MSIHSGSSPVVFRALLALYRERIEECHNTQQIAFEGLVTSIHLCSDDPADQAVLMEMLARHFACMPFPVPVHPVDPEPAAPLSHAAPNHKAIDFFSDGMKIQGQSMGMMVSDQEVMKSFQMLYLASPINPVLGA